MHETKVLLLFTDDVEEGKTLMIKYKNRFEAETAMLKSNQFNERPVRLTWHTSSLGDSSGKNIWF